MKWQLPAISLPHLISMQNYNYVFQKGILNQLNICFIRI